MERLRSRLIKSAAKSWLLLVVAVVCLSLGQAKSGWGLEDWVKKEFKDFKNVGKDLKQDFREATNEVAAEFEKELHQGKVVGKTDLAKIKAAREKIAKDLDKTLSKALSYTNKLDDIAGEAAEVLHSSALVRLGYKRLKLGDLSDFESHPDDSQELYRLYLKTIGQDESLIVKVITDDPFSDPDVFLSLTDAAPHSPGSSDFECASEGAETCTIPSSFLMDEMQRTGKVELEVFIGVICKKRCKYQIHSSLEKTMELKDKFETQVDIDA